MRRRKNRKGGGCLRPFKKKPKLKTGKGKKGNIVPSARITVKNWKGKGRGGRMGEDCISSYKKVPGNGDQPAISDELVCKKQTK